MTNQEQAQQLRQAINGFASALNTANTAALAEIFTQDGKFMPQGFKTLNVEEMQSSGNHYLAVNSFQISFEIQDLDIADDFATVTAEGKTSESKPGTAKTIEKTSRDFLVFKKVDGYWKIHRYIFNHFAV